MGEWNWKKWLTGFLSAVLVFTSIMSTGIHVFATEITDPETSVEEVETDEEDDTVVPVEEETDGEVTQTVIEDNPDEEAGQQRKNSEEVITETEGENEEGELAGAEGVSGQVEEDEAESLTDEMLSLSAEDRLELMTSAGDIASGTYKDIAWVIDANGKLTVNGSGEFSECADKIYRAPWWDNSKQIKEAKIIVIGTVNASSMFADCNNLTSLDLTGFDTSNVTDMSNMFWQCHNLTNLDLTIFDTSKVVNMSCMFGGCMNLTKLDISGFDTSEVMNMSCMFLGCRNLIKLDVSRFDTSKVMDMQQMFDFCEKLTDLDVRGFDTRKVTNMLAMFEDCGSLTSLELDGFDTSTVEHMDRMFYGCSSLTNLDLSGFDVRNVKRMLFMLGGCENLTTIHSPYNIDTPVTLPRSSPTDNWFLSGGIKVTDLPRNLSYSVILGKNYIPEEPETELEGITINKKETASNIVPPKDKSMIQIIDGKTGEPISGARIWVGSEHWTRADGTVELNNTGLTTIQVEKDGYHRKAAKKKLEKGKCFTIILCPDTGDVEILSATLNLLGEDEDVLNGVAYLIHGDWDYTDGVDATFILTVESAGRAEKYQLIQNGKIIQENTTGIFNLKGKYSGDTSFYVDELSSGHAVSVRVYGRDDKEARISRKQELGIKVSEGSSISLDIKEMDGRGKIDLGDKLSVTIPGNIPILGGSRLDLGFEEKIKIAFNIDNSGKVRIALNMREFDTKDSAAWYDKKKEFSDLASRAKRLGDSASTFGGTPVSFGAGMYSVDGNIMGYGEGYIDDATNKFTSVNVGIIMSVKGGARYTQYYFLGFTPVYITYGGGISASATGEIGFSYVKGSGIQVNGGSLETEISPYITLEGGVGADGITSIGAYGKATLSWIHRYINRYNKVSLNGNVKVRAQVFIWSKVLAEFDGTWVLYDSNRRSSDDFLQGSGGGIDYFDMSGAELISMDYLDRREENAGISPLTAGGGEPGEVRVLDYAYEDASPQLIKAGNKLYLFYLDGVAGRSAQNQTALFYQFSSDNGASWSKAVRVDGGANETADYDFDVAVNGDKIYVVWSDAGKVYGDEILSMDSAQAIAQIGREMNLMFAVIDSGTGAVQTRTISTPNADLQPQTVVGSDGTVYVAWITNDVSSGKGLLSNENRMGICFASSAENYAVHSIALEGKQYPLTLDMGILNSQICIAADLDVDGDLNTQEDREIYTMNVSTGALARQTSNGFVDSVPLFGRVAGENLLFWYQDGNIAYTSNGQEVSLVFHQDNLPPIGQEFALLEGDNGKTAIAWTATSAEEDAGVDVYCSDGNGTVWRSAYKLGGIDSQYTTSLSGFMEGNDHRMAYLGSEYRESGLASHICMYTPLKRIDTSAAWYMEETATPGKICPFKLVVTNTGNTPVTEVSIQSSNNASGSVTTAKANPIMPGSSREFNWSILVPKDMTDIFYCDYTVTAYGETDLSDNVITVSVGEPDFSVEAYQDYSSGEMFAGVIVTNSGILSSDAILTVYKDEAHTEKLYETTMPGIAGGESKLTVLDLTVLDRDAQVFYFVVSDGKGMEIHTGNNEALLYIGKGAYLEDGQEIETPTPEPTTVPPVPTPEPTAVPTPVPTSAPTIRPTTAPPVIPTPVPTAMPTSEPSVRPTAVPPSSWPFLDVAVKPGNWRYDNVKFVYEYGIMTGVKADQFQPDVPLTRAQFASVIYRMAGTPKVSYKGIFTDVPAGKWYSDAIIWAYENGIVAGLGGGRYGVNENITREQMARMLMEFARVQGYDTSTRADFANFADGSQVSRWAAENMRWAVGSGIISGSTKDGKYYMNPKGEAKRVECAVMLTKFIQKYL